MERNRRRRLWDSAEYWYSIKNIMLSVNELVGEFFFMCDIMNSDNISLGEYLDTYFEPRTLRTVVTNSKSIRSVCISNKKDIHNSSCTLHKLSDFK